MAITVAEANAVSSAHYDKTLTQVAYDSSQFWVKMKKNNRVRVKGGADLRWPLRYQEFGYANAVDPHSQIVFSSKETRTSLVEDWKYYITPQLMSWDERVKNSNGPSQIISLMADKTEEMREDHDERFSDDLYVANPNGQGFTPLTTIIDSAATYAGVAVADVAAWAATEDNTTTQLNLYGSGSIAVAVASATFGKQMPTLHVTTRNLATKAESLIEPQKRYYDEQLADAGFKSVTFHGAPIMGDSHCTASMWLGVCMEVIEIWVHPDFDMVLTPWEDMTQAGFPNALGRTLSWAGNFVCRNRKPNFKFTALNYAL